MARPIKDGVDYFPLDTDFFQDDKIRLIKTEFGAKGITILISLLCEIYRGNGYFKVWDNDSCLLMADAVGCGIVPENITQVVQGCLRRSVFNDGVFQMFGILTSAGIQRRYLRAVSTRDDIGIISEYWLLDVDDKKDVPAYVRNKLIFKSVNLKETPESFKKTPVNLQNNPQRRVKERRVKESKEGGAPDAPAPPTTPSITQDSLVAQYGQSWVDIYLSKAAKKYHLTGDNALLKVAEWLAVDKEAGKLDASESENSRGKRLTSFDLEEYEQSVAGFVPEYKKGGDA